MGWWENQIFNVILVQRLELVLELEFLFEIFLLLGCARLSARHGDCDVGRAPLFACRISYRLRESSGSLVAAGGWAIPDTVARAAAHAESAVSGCGASGLVPAATKPEDMAARWADRVEGNRGCVRVTSKPHGRIRT